MGSSLHTFTNLDGDRFVVIRFTASSIPGLGIDEWPGGPRFWCVTHLATDKRITRCDTRAHALQLARLLAQRADWTQPLDTHADRMRMWDVLMGAERDMEVFDHVSGSFSSRCCGER